MTSHHVLLLFADLALILVLVGLLHRLCRRLGQPPVIGEILVGVLLGPTLLGAGVAGALFPGALLPALHALGNLGLALLMFTVGMEIDARVLRGGGRRVAGVVIGAVTVPFVLSLPLGLFLLRDHTPSDRGGFLLFLGVAMSVTAFPVLARILIDLRLQRTPLGSTALASAAVGDVLCWALLALAVAMTGGAQEVPVWQSLLIVPFAAGMLLVAGPLLRRPGLFRAGDGRAGDGRAGTGRAGQDSGTPLIVVFGGLLLCCAATEWMGFHFIFGAFLFGVVMPREGPLAGQAVRATAGIGSAVLLPVYFVLAGLRVDLSDFDGGDLIDLALILLVAIAGKFAGGFAGAYTQGFDTRQSTAMGALMNTRGITELVVLGAGLDLGLLDGELFSLMVVMALVTTGMTTPLVRRLGVVSVGDEVVRGSPGQVGERGERL
ncbi:cation:proton antiporter domain-containing protein [Streptomyces sp. NPDC001985]|uniref:cation:proton antiporter domain-containing protein n=1 Tax=Streptomyces sp. NPDC001985 TaxID=3154406 RepID=UPI00331A9054